MNIRYTFLSRLGVLSIGITLLTSSIAVAQIPEAAARMVPAPTFGTTTPAKLVLTPELARLVNGKNLWITRSDGRRFEGVVRVSAEGLTAGDGKNATLVPFDQVASVQKVSHRVRNYAFAGLGVGAAVGTAAYFATDCHSMADHGCSQLLGFSVLGGLGGAGIGAILNAKKKDSDLLWDARRSTKTIGLAPIVSPTRKGMGFSVTWR